MICTLRGQREGERERTNGNRPTGKWGQADRPILPPAQVTSDTPSFLRHTICRLSLAKKKGKVSTQYWLVKSTLL